MKWLYLLPAFIFFSSKAMYWSPKRKMPYEIESLIKSIQWNDLKPSLKKKFKSNVGKIDFMINKISDKDFYFLTKAMTYKYLLKHHPINQIPVGFYDTNPFLSSKFKKESIKLIPFGQWLLATIVRDLREIHRTPNYRSFLKWRKKTGLATPEVKKIEKRLNLIVPWFIFFQKRSVQEANWDLQPILSNVLSNLGDHFKVYWELKNSQKLTWPKNFKISWFTSQKKETENKRESLLNIVEDTVKKHELKNLPLPINDWIPNNSDFASKLTPNPKNQQPRSNYNPPKTLPKPIDDWVFEY